MIVIRNLVNRLRISRRCTSNKWPPVGVSEVGKGK